MKSMHYLLRCTLLGGMGLTLLLALPGCLNFKPVTDDTRYFVLSSMPSQEPARPPDPHPPALGVGFIVMPDYLKGNRLAARQGTNEIRYHEWFLWAEDLDKGLLRVLSLNLSRLLSTRDIYLLDWDRGAVDFEVNLTVFRFESDTQGRATLEVAWTITRPGGLELVRAGTTHLETNGPSISEDPPGAVTALSALVADFSRELAGVLRELTAKQTSAMAHPSSRGAPSHLASHPLPSAMG